MSLPTIEEMTNLYLYGSTKKPVDLKDSILIRSASHVTNIDVDINEYMDGPGRYVSPANFYQVDLFLRGNNSSDIPPGRYKEDEIFDFFNISEKYKTHNISQYEYDSESDDYAERVYVWNSSSFEIDERTTVFVVRQDGSRYIENLSIIPTNGGPENFDFESTGLAQYGNEFVLEPQIDPSKIGRKVVINFTGNRNYIPSYELSDFITDVQNLYEKNGNLILDTLPAMLSVIDDVHNDNLSARTVFDGRAIIYGSDSDDEINGYITPSGNTDISSFSHELQRFTENGIVYVAGSGNDEIIGNEYQDILYGNSGNDTLDGSSGSDQMYGGTEDDIYIVDDENDEVIEYENEGDDRVESSVTYSLTDNVEALTLTGTDHIDGTGNSLDNFIFGNEGNNTLNGEAGNDDILGYLGDDTLYGGDNDDYLTGGEGDDVLYGGSDNDGLYGEDDNDELYGEDGGDHLEGGAGNDLLDGGAGDDLLRGGSGQDTLKGGAGFDTYYVDGQDIVNDADEKGQVLFNNRLLTGGSRTEDYPENTFYGGGNTYVLNGSTLTVNGSLVIQNYSKVQASLRIVLTEEEEEEDETPDVDDAENRTSPIVIDLDGDGIETLEVGSSYFDLDADGLSEMTGWVSPDDGLLVHDRDGNGRISNGTELFGNYSTLDNGDTAENGFQALAEYDDNGDGIVDAQDASYENLQVWRDLNGNGVSDSGEFQSLADAGVVSVSTEYATSDYIDDNGHAHRQVSTVMLSDGTASTAADVWFKIDSARRMNSGDVELTPEVVSLANAKGFGKVQDLWQAMVHDAELVSLLNQYVEATDPATRDTLLDGLIYRWAGADSIDPYSRDPSKVYGHVMDARQLVTLENLVGHSYLGTWCWGERDPNPHGQAAPLLIAEYLEFKRFTAAQILAQTEYAEELDISMSKAAMASGMCIP
jgi:hypothetical protein